MSDAPLLTRARRVNAATVFPAAFEAPEELPSLEAAMARLRQLLAGRPAELKPGRAAFPDFDDFWAISVRTGGAWLCAYADRWVDEGDMLAALAVLKGALA